MVATLTPNQIANNPAAFASVFLRILDKEKRLAPLRWNKAQAHFHAQRTGRDLILKARQLGFSTYMQGELFRRTVTSTRATATISHKDETTQILRQMSDRFWKNCKFNDIQPQRKYANASMTTYPEFDSMAIIATAGSPESGRGGTYTDIHGSEVAFWKDAERLVAGVMQGGNPDVVLESTPNGAQGYFYERCMEAIRGDGIWKLHFYPWWWDDSYRIPLDAGEQIQLAGDEETLVEKFHLTPEQIKWRRYKQKELRALFTQEYPEDPITCFLTSGNSYFGDLTGVFTAPMNAVYQPDHVYVAGLDFGQTNDYTAMPVLDITARCQVDLLHINKLEWKEQRRRIKEKYKYWHCQRMGAEWNSIGSVNIEALQDDGMLVIPFETTNESKSEIMSDLYEALHTHNWKLQDHPVQRHEMQTYVSTQTPTGLWRLAAEGDGHDDTVMGLGIAKWVAIQAVSLPKSQPKQPAKYQRDERLTRY